MEFADLSRTGKTSVISRQDIDMFIFNFINKSLSTVMERDLKKILFKHAIFNEKC